MSSPWRYSLSPRLRSRRGSPPLDPADPTGPIFALPPAALLRLGLLTFCVLLAEGAPARP